MGLILAHIGITLGAFCLLAYAVKKIDNNHLKDLGLKDVDYRIILLGSMLPDIIDKPLGTIIFADSFSNGRIFAHTLIFTVSLAFLGLLFYTKTGRIWLLAVSFCTLFHLILDSMWQKPGTLFWPLFGSFPKEDTENWAIRAYQELAVDHNLLIMEVVGLLILICFFIWRFKLHASTGTE